MKQVNWVVEASNTLYKAITEDLSRQSTKRYKHDTLTLEELDRWRHTQLPDVLKTRYAKEKKCWLSKDELVLLMDWKLAKGKFRPTLPALIKSNSAESVETITEKGFGILLTHFENSGKSPWKELTSDTKQKYLEAVKESCDELCNLRGVGPATASLVASLTSGINQQLAPPFFSDESFMYYILDPLRPGTKIKYNIKEYVDELVSLYADIMKQYPEVESMTQLETGGWSLKMYDICKFDKLVDIKLPKQLEDLDALFPSQAVTRLEVEKPRKKRKVR